MELQDLRCFMAVAQQLNFTRAADDLHVTQPTLSRRIRDLEVELGAQLFDRGYHEVVLTPKGEVLQREAYEVLQRADAIPALLDAVPVTGDVAFTGVLRVGHQAAIDYSVASAAVDRMSKLHPGVRPFVSRHGLGELREGLRAGALDAAFMLISEYDQHRGMVAYKVGESRVVAIVPAGHPLAGRGEIDLGELAGLDVVMLERAASPQTVDFVSGRCLAHGFSLHAAEYVRSAEDAFMRVAAGRGVSFAHSTAPMLERAAEVGVNVLEITGEDMSLDLAVACREDDERPVVREFLRIAREMGKRLGM